MTSGSITCRVLVLLGVVTLTACPDPSADGRITVDNYCPTFASIICEGYRTCCELEDVDSCVAPIAAECEAGEISSIRAGLSRLDGEVARRCLDAYQAAFADCQYNDDLDNACRFQWYGSAQEGENCRDVWQCTPGLACSLEGTQGTCVALPGEGESCETSTACRPEGLYCSYEDWFCYRKPGLNEPCERTGICEAGVCVEGTCQAVSWCG